MRHLGSTADTLSLFKESHFIVCVREDGGSLKALYALHYCDRPMRWQRAREKVREERR